MVRECQLVSSIAVAIAASGCSLILDFSDDAIPKDAPVDMPFTQEQCDFKEPNDSVAAPATLAPGDVGPGGAICPADPEDHDFYRFSGPASTASVVINLTFTSRPGGDLDLRLLDTGGAMLAQSRGFLDNEKITCPASSPSCAAHAAGDYIIEVLPGSMGAVNNYQVELTITPM